MITKVRVVGAGAMGRGIAQTAAAAGFTVQISDVSVDAVRSAVEFITKMLRRAAEKGQCSAEEAEAAIGRIHPLEQPDEPAGDVDLVVEAVLEDLAVKQSLFGRLEAALPNAILASNTSSLSITAIAAGLSDPGRLVGMHFFNPVPLMRVAEIIPGLRSADRNVEACRQFVADIGHTPVRCQDSPGFLVNHIGRALVTEALALLAERIAEPDQIDQLARDCLGLKMGPFELMDLTGLDVTHAVTQIVSEGFYGEPRLRPSALAQTRVAAGLFGRKTGAGFYRYPDPTEQRTEQRITPDATAIPLHLHGLSELTERFVAAGATVMTGPVPQSVSLLPVIGEPTYRAAARAGLDPRTTIGVDPLTLDRPRMAVVASPQTDPGLLAKALQVITATGPRVTATADGAAPVVQRLAASIVNLGCAVAERGLASTADIDSAVRLALGYPSGPLELGDRIGPGLILQILEGIVDFTGDPRYRPTSWLRMHAECGLPLSAEITRPTGFTADS